MHIKDINIENIRQEIYELLQTQCEYRPLDSLETCVIRASLSSHNINIPQEINLSTNTIGGWLSWVQQYLKNG